MKKILTMLLALVMIFSLSVTAFAADTTTYTLTIENAAGHTYEVYQIYTGDLSKEGDTTVLSNIKYGQNYYPNSEPGEPVPDDELDDIKTPQDAIDTFLTAVKGDPIANDVTPAERETSVAIDGLKPGYYMVVDVTEGGLAEETKSAVILQIVDNVTIASKHATISSEKKVMDTNDSTGETSGWQDSADHDVGDAVPFKLSVTIPSTYTNYDDYTVVFHDMQAAGFDNPVITSVYVANASGEKISVIPAIAGDVIDGYTLKTGACGESECEFGASCSFSVTVGDLKKLVNNYSEGMQVVVEYTAILEDDAVIGSAGNENGMYVAHPDGHTPEDYVIVFTYKLTANKIDGATGDDLTGASFELFKWVADDSTAGGSWVSKGVVAGEETSLFMWKGIDDGKYKLVETVTPEGYNTMAPLEFEVTAEHKDVWTKGGEPAFIKLTTKDAATGNDVFPDVVSGNVYDGQMEGTLTNNKGTVLPETGAEGTAMFIGLGSLLTLVAVVFLVTRKKMSIYED